MHNCNISGNDNSNNISLTFSVFIIDSFDKVLIVKRNIEKPLWDLPCYAKVSNPNNIINEAEQIVINDLGIHCNLEESFTATRENILPNGEVELEENHILIGRTNTFPTSFPSCILDFKRYDIVSVCYGTLSREEEYTVNIISLISKIFLKLNSR